jgi:dihydrodipicolinate synthase/N-acetylneuraminate lyase
LLAGVGRDSVRNTLELAKFAAEAGYDAIAVRAPEFYGQQSMERDTMTYFLTIADQSPLPVVVLAEMERPVRMDVIGSLAQHPNVIGAIDQAASRERCETLFGMAAGISRDVTVTTTFAAVTRRMAGETEAAGNLVSAKSLAGGVAVSLTTPVKTRTKRVGFQYLTASTDSMLVPWQAGASGAVPRLGAAAPQACCEVWQAFKDGDEALAAEKQARIQKAASYVQGWAGISTLKYACDLNAYFGGPARLPLLPPSTTYREGIERELAGLKN